MEAISFTCTYDLAAFFEPFKELNISVIAARSDINTNLLQQYVSGNKRASASLAKKVEAAVHQLADELTQIVLSSNAAIAILQEPSQRGGKMVSVHVTPSIVKHGITKF